MREVSCISDLSAFDIESLRGVGAELAEYFT